MISVAKSVLARWNASGLDESIAALYPGGGANVRKNNSSGSPVGDAFPRAEYTYSTPPPMEKTRGSRVFQVPITIRVYRNDSFLQVGSDVILIRSKFVNAETTMMLEDGTILEVDESGAVASKVDDQVFMGQIVLGFRVRIGNEEVVV